MASLKEVKSRINTVKNTRKITSAMKMVASAKLHKAQNALFGMMPYQQKLTDIMTGFLGADISIASPYVLRREVKRVAVVAFSSNSSLCGAFNANVIKMLAQTVKEYRSLGKENILLYTVGKKVDDAARRMGLEVQGTYQNLADKPNYADAAALATELMQKYAAGEVDEVQLLFYHFKSTGMQTLQRETFLPIDLTQLAGSKPATMTNYIVEPSAEALITSLIPTALKHELFAVAVDSNASEHAARMIAMLTATENANDLIQELTILYNKSRQQAITNELLDIVGGSYGK